MLPEKKTKIDACLRQISRGKTDYVDELYDLVQANLFYVALKYMGGRDQAEDLLADFWCDIVRIAKKYKFFANAFSYLCKVLTNMALSQLRSEGKRAEREIPVTTELLERYDVFCTYDVFRTEEAQRLRAAVRKGLCLLTEKERIVVYLTYWEEKTVRECAASMGLSKSTAERIKISAMQKLKNVLEKEGWDKTDVDAFSVHERSAMEAGR